MRNGLSGISGDSIKERRDRGDVPGELSFKITQHLGRYACRLDYT